MLQLGELGGQRRDWAGAVHGLGDRRALNLRRPIYRKTAAFGHFGRSEEGFTWEVADKAEALKESAAAVHAVAR